MPPLIKTNRYLRDPRVRRRMIAEKVYDSSVFEGAIGLPKPNLSTSRQRKMASSKRQANSKRSKEAPDE